MEKRDLFLYSNNKNLHRIAKKRLFFYFEDLVLENRSSGSLSCRTALTRSEEKRDFPMCFCCWANTRHFRIREFGVRYVQKTLLT